MRGEAELTAPEVAFVLGTRAAVGIGLGMLLASQFPEAERRAVGWTLLLAGAFAGAVLGAELFGNPRRFKLEFGQQ
jgi:multisubunit Na+/H+ antiporter MnhB subunit